MHVTVLVYFTLGDSNHHQITTDNTEILITDIGQDANSGLPSLTCHTDLMKCCRGKDHSGSKGLGQWTDPNRGLIPKRKNQIEQDFYFTRPIAMAIQLIRNEIANPLSPTGSYCCTVPTTGGDMTLCANLGE